MQEDQRLERLDILKLETKGEVPVQSGLVKYRQLKERLFNLCVSYRDGKSTKLYDYISFDYISSYNNNF
jgi:hypothetical protein